MLSRSSLSQRFAVFGRFAGPPSLPVHASHRGGRHWGRENTMETYSRAVHEARTDLLEIDIWKSVDDQLVLNHDGIIDGRAVTEKTLEQLRQIDPELVTLDQVLVQFSPVTSLAFFFDMKDATAIPLTLDAIHRHQLTDRVIFGAVDRRINVEVHKAKPHSIPLCADVETMMQIVEVYRQGQLTASYPYDHDLLGFFVEAHTRAAITADLIESIHRAGKPVAVVGSLLDRDEVQREMIQLGLDILFTDRPDVLRQTLDSIATD